MNTGFGKDSVMHEIRKVALMSEDERHEALSSVHSLHNISVLDKGIKYRPSPRQTNNASSQGRKKSAVVETSWVLREEAMGEGN